MLPSTPGGKLAVAELWWKVGNGILLFLVIVARELLQTVVGSSSMRTFRPKIRAACGIDRVVDVEVVIVRCTVFETKVRLLPGQWVPVGVCHVAGLGVGTDVCLFAVSCTCFRIPWNLKTALSMFLKLLELALRNQYGKIVSRDQNFH
jgi:hypothetical protein